MLDSSVLFRVDGRLHRLAGAAVIGVSLLGLSSAAAGEHPTIRDPEQAKCGNCHSDLLSGEFVHAAAEDDCLTCHEFSESNGSLTVSLSMPTPGLCVQCHDTLEKEAEGEVASMHAPVVDGCTDCHSPHSGPSPRMLSALPPDLCLECHDQEEVDGAHGVAVSGADCRLCHAPHGSEDPPLLNGKYRHEPFAEGSCDSCHRKGLGRRTRLMAKGAELCYACHGELEDAFAAGTVHPPVAQGRCTECHSPHLGPAPRMLVETLPGLCLRCHEGVRERLAGKVVHPPVEEGCDLCHDPHRSDNHAMLELEPPDLCFQCHDADAALQARHLGAKLETLNCLLCHDPHGSSEPGLIAAGSQHPPFLESCDNCHEGRFDQFVEKGNDLCTMCHDGVLEAGEAVAVPHSGFVDGSCIDCHTPHASPRARLVRGPTREVCGQCHEDVLPEEGDRLHQIIDVVGCQACHEPHGGPNPRLLRRADPSELCLECHQSQGTAAELAQDVRVFDRFDIPGKIGRRMRVVALQGPERRGHPVAHHIALGTPSERDLAIVSTTHEGALACLSCHDPHKGGLGFLAPKGPKGEYKDCSSCHEKK